jgi:PAS domain S-box-containing protein
MDTKSEAIKLNALIVEDNIDDLELNVYQLKKSFREVRYTHARNLKEFLSASEKSVASQNNAEKFDVILSDWSVPRYDGYAALAALQRIDPTIPFIVVSGAIGESTAVSLIKAGAYDFVLKEQSDHLAHVILKALEWSNQKKKENIQRFQIELQTKALQASPIALSILHIDGSIQWVNNSYSTLTGYSLEDLSGHFFWEFFTDYNRSKFQKIFSKMQKEDLYQCEGISTRKDGTAYYELRQISKMINAQNEIQRFLFIRQDITLPRQAHLRLEIDAELPQELEGCDSEECLYETTATYLKKTFSLRSVRFLKTDEHSHRNGEFLGNEMGQLIELARE